MSVATAKRVLDDYNTRPIESKTIENQKFAIDVVARVSATTRM